MSSKNQTHSIVEADLIATGLKTTIVAGRFNALIVEKLVEGALDALKRHGADLSDQEVIWVPGGFEIPLAAKWVAEKKKADAIICLGAVIRGGTPHFDFVAGEANKGIGQIQLEYGVPVSMGVLTTNSIEQAIERAGTKMGNKGAEAAMAAVEMANLRKLIG